jgi:hypothetical protein
MRKETVTFVLKRGPYRLGQIVYAEGGGACSLRKPVNSVGLSVNLGAQKLHS